ncbi:MAG: AAA family ATPase [Lentihominibacter sp.]
MFVDLNDRSIQPDSINDNYLKEVIIPNDQRAALEEMLLSEETFAKVFDTTTIVKPDRNYVFFSNYWFYLAVLCKKYAEALYPYCLFFDEKIRNNPDIVSALSNSQYEYPEFVNLFDNDLDRTRMVKFIEGDSEFRPGKALFNVRNGNGVSIRSCKDIFGSCVLKKIPVPDASSGYLGNVIYYLAKNTAVYDSLESAFNSEIMGDDGLSNSSKKAENTLYYGVPGSGKSHTIDSIVENSEYERVVFHPDYTYSDFVGQIMPRLKRNADGTEKLTYEFVPGPFTKALKAAVDNEDSMHYLVIEEINRGNAPAIFGDVFQLLDRNEDGSGKYHITNFDIAREVYGDEAAEIRIPSNLSILATMNTSDQNVFTLDTAFQRRWNMKYIENNVAEAEHANEKIEYSDVTWGGFAGAVNEEILEYNADLSSSEDKQLGAYFVTRAELASDKFPEKALKYLWDDAFKLEREKIFRPEIKSVGDLVHSYDVEIQNDRDPIKGVMRAEVYRKMMDMSASGPEEAIDESEIFEAEINDGE